jgi:hypothetical protein
MQVKLAEALLRRKELEAKVALLKSIKESSLFEIKAKRVKVTDDIDDIVASVPRVTISQITAEYDWHARQLRLVDAAIQQANWTTELTVAESIFGTYKID